MPKVQYSCNSIKSDGTICAKLSAWNYPCHFTQPKEKYMCRKCATKLSQNRPEVKQRKSDNGIKRYEDPEERKKQSERQQIAQNRPEVKKHKSEVATKRFEDPEERKRHSERMILALDHPEVRRCMSESAIKRCDDPKERQRLSERSKISQNRPDVKQRKSESLRITNARPEVKKRRSESAKISGAQPELQKKRSDNGIKRYEDPKERELQSERIKIAKSRPELKQQRLETNARPDVKQRKSESQTKRFASVEERKQISMTKQGITDDADWKGFISAGEYCDKWTNPKYKVRKRVRARSGDCCDVCGKTYEENDNTHMSVHHVHRDKNACCEGEKTDWIFAALCKHCHNVYGHNEEGTQYLREVITIERGNKCMLSLEEYNELYPNGSDGDKRWGYANGK